jgi:hypothetical protein
LFGRCAKDTRDEAASGRFPSDKSPGAHSFALLGLRVRKPLLHHPRRALAQERAHRRADLAHVANELVILIRPQLHDDAHCAAATSVHVRHSLPPAGSARLAVGRVTRSPTDSPRYAPHPYPCRRFRFQSDLGAARTRLYSGYPQQPARGGHQKEIAKHGGRVRRHRKSHPVRVRGVGDERVPDSEIGCCVPLATSR